MTEVELQDLLNELIAGWENEVVEFKDVGDSYSTSDIGKYFSALANEANLRGKDRGWLVFGVDDKTRAISDSDYRRDHARLHGLKNQIAQDTEPNITFREIHELNTPGGRVVMFEIPAAPLGMPISWRGHYYARAGESLVALGLDKLDEIRSQTAESDWSAGVVPQARLTDLDAEAIRVARANFTIKHSNRFTAETIAGWSDQAFLDRCRLTVGGQLTRTAILLLGREESSHLLTPHPTEITWKLVGDEQAYEHFHTPFLLSSSRLYARIRNIQIRILPEDSLLAIEMAKYDQKIVLEALHNCIAHQDYRQNSRIIVTEHADRLVLSSVGVFFQGTPADYFSGQKTPTRYRNPFLAQAMASLNMIDTMGYGIREMFLGQARRYFPMPDYDLSDPQSVRLTIYGKIVDLAYTRLLIQHTALELEDILALDRIQKRLPIDVPTIRRLRRQKLIEGHKPNLHVTASIAAATATKADYIRTRAQDDEFYSKLVVDYLKKFGSATRSEIDTLLREKLSTALTEPQKDNRIRNLLTKMRTAGLIQNAGGRKSPKWVLVENEG